MSDIVIQVDRLSKRYRLGVVGSGTLAHDLNRWWARIRGKEDPLLRIGETHPHTKTVGGEEPRVEEENASSDYMWALDNVSFEVRCGEVLGIIGCNGAGKSTLLKILSRVTAPTSGDVNVRGRIASLLEVGTGFHPELTGRENIFLNGAILGMRKAEIARKLDEIVDFSEVHKFIDTPVKRYSSGMYVRLAFAVAAHLEHEILIVDEVLAVGDASFQKKCLGKMQDVAGQGRTVLFVSHNMGAVKELCNSGILLVGGRISESGSADTVVDNYLKQARSEGAGRRGKRHPEFDILLVDAEVLDASGRSGQQFDCQSLLVIRYHIHNGGDQRRISLFTSVEDLAGRRLFASQSSLEGKFFDVDTGDTHLDFVVPNLPLRPGMYSASVTVHLAEPDICIDSIYQVRHFEVQEPKRDFFYGGHLGAVEVKHLWLGDRSASRLQELAGTSGDDAAATLRMRDEPQDTVHLRSQVGTRIR